MENKQISQEVLKTIENQKLKPKAKILFILKEYGMWIFAGISVLLGSLATAVIIFVSKNNDWPIYKQAGYSFSKFFLLNIPYFWLILMIVFGFIFYKNFRHTKKGYKFSLEKIIAIIILASVILGIFFYNIGLGQAIENTFTKKIPFYNKFLNPRMRMWNKPQQGMLGGRLILDPIHQELRLRDINEKEWELLIQEQAGLKPGEFIKMIGERANGNKFKPAKLLPWDR